jgi:hypothetical protein
MARSSPLLRGMKMTLKPTYSQGTTCHTKRISTSLC